MTLNHGGLLTSCFVILFAIAAIESASAAPLTLSSVMQHRHHGAQMPHRHTLYNYYYTSPAVPRPGCYLPSDGCPNEYIGR
jgi:hypothetical protein